LIGAEGEPIGVVGMADALQKAREAGLDLVEIAPTANPPVCRIMNFGKFIYQQNKKQQDSK
jgi:translation initiation factor IF-3